MGIYFKKISAFKQGIIFDLLSDAYSYDDRNREYWGNDWKAFDDFFFENLNIADQSGFITTLDNEAIGLVSWNPTNRPNYVEIGHNCILSKYKGNGYGKMQMQEALRRINRIDVMRIIVTTNSEFFPAQRMYESVGFQVQQIRKNEEITKFIGDYIDYILAY